MNLAPTSPTPVLTRAQRPALVVGVGALLLSLVGAFFNHEAFFRAYLVAYIFWAGLALGGIALALLIFLAGGLWGVVIRRVVEAGTYTIPLIALMFVPLLFGLGDLYPWARSADVQRDALLQHQSAYLNVPFFIIRAALYFVIWIALAYFVNRWSRTQDERDDPEFLQRIRRPAGFAIVLFGLSVTFALIDWTMSLEPHWFSTIYPGMVAMGAVLTTFAFVIVIVALLAQQPPLSEVLSRKLFNDLGSLLLAFVMMWAYLSFSQFMLIWAGNLSEEIPWYVRRLQGGWETIALIMTLSQFALPFALLLFRDLKRNRLLLAIVAGLIVIGRYVDLYWLVTPGVNETGGPLNFSWLDLVTCIGLGGIWLAAFVWQLNRRPLLPLHDPRLTPLGEAEAERELVEA